MFSSVDRVEREKEKNTLTIENVFGELKKKTQIWIPPKVGFSTQEREVAQNVLDATQNILRNNLPTSKGNFEETFGAWQASRNPVGRQETRILDEIMRIQRSPQSQHVLDELNRFQQRHPQQQSRSNESSDGVANAVKESLWNLGLVATSEGVWHSQGAKVGGAFDLISGAVDASGDWQTKVLDSVSSFVLELGVERLTGSPWQFTLAVNASRIGSEVIQSVLEGAERQFNKENPKLQELCADSPYLQATLLAPRIESYNEGRAMLFCVQWAVALPSRWEKKISDTIKDEIRALPQMLLNELKEDKQLIQALGSSLKEYAFKVVAMPEKTIDKELNK